MCIFWKKGFYLFKFNSFDDSQKVLEAGSWFMFGHPRILKRGSGKLNLHKEDLKTMAIWIKFPSLNLACKTVNGLSKLASCIGIPFCRETLTASGSNPSHTRVLVDVSAESPLPDSLKFLCKGNPLEQEVEYLWKPNACKNCHIFNHSTRFCPFAQKQHSQASQKDSKGLQARMGAEDKQRRRDG